MHFYLVHLEYWFAHELKAIVLSNLVLKSLNIVRFFENSVQFVAKNNFPSKIPSNL